jgi:hypothetical protein
LQSGSTPEIAENFPIVFFEHVDNVESCFLSQQLIPETPFCQTVYQVPVLHDPGTQEIVTPLFFSAHRSTSPHQ